MTWADGEEYASLGMAWRGIPPDFNPVEMLCAKLKALLRRAADRTIPSLWHAIGRLLDDFSAAECSCYLAHAGYGSI